MQLIILISWLTITQSGILVLHREHITAAAGARSSVKLFNFTEIVISIPLIPLYRISFNIAEKYFHIVYIPTFIMRISIKHFN